MNKSKILGQTFTSYNEVEKMLSMFKGNILKSKILEPSFGEGAFLLEIGKRIIVKGLKEKKTKKSIANILNNNLFGFEIDTIFFEKCIENLNTLIEHYKLNEKIPWNNLKHSSILGNINDRFDLIIGNPPYVRIQNFENRIRSEQKKLSRSYGNTDLFLIFIDTLLKNMSKNGEFIFIVPNSLGKSRAAKKIRNFMFENGVINYIDFEDKQLFPKVSVYSCIFRYKNNKKGNSTFQVGYKGKKSKLINNNYFLPNSYKKIKNNLNVKNGIATLLDKIFIHLEKPKIENEYVKRIYKGSKQNQIFYAIFPYKVKKQKLIKFNSEKELQIEAPKLHKYLRKYKKELMSRSLEKNTKWFEYGRSQAIKNIGKEKIMINTLIHPKAKTIQVKKIPKGSLVFSGLYSTSFDFNKFNNYDLIKSLRFKAKDMRGGYKKISSSLFKNDR